MVPNRLSLLSAFLVGSAVIGALTGCAGASVTGAPAGGSSDASSTQSADTVIRIVASTNVYGDIAEQIGGDVVSVTSIIDDPNKDPHEYQASGQNQLSLSKADIVIENGAGYDDFVDSMLSSAKNPDVVVVNAASLSGYDLHPASGDFNEHLWYDVPTVAKVAAAIADQLRQLDPADATTFTANQAAFQAGLDTLATGEADLTARVAGNGVLVTEPVSLYLLEACGLVNQTPPAFSAAVENDSDVAPDVLSSTIALLTQHLVEVLVYNSQTTGPQTDAVLTAAHSAQIPVVAMTETLPVGSTYLSWMTANLDAVKGAVL